MLTTESELESCYETMFFKKILTRKIDKKEYLEKMKNLREKKTSFYEKEKYYRNCLIYYTNLCGDLMNIVIEYVMQIEMYEMKMKMFKDYNFHGCIVWIHGERFVYPLLDQRDFKAMYDQVSWCDNLVDIRNRAFISAYGFKKIAEYGQDVCDILEEKIKYISYYLGAKEFYIESESIAFKQISYIG